MQDDTFLEIHGQQRLQDQEANFFTFQVEVQRLTLWVPSGAAYAERTMPCSTTNTPWLPWRGPCAGVLPSWLPFSKPKPSLLPSAWQKGEWECAQKHLQAGTSSEHQQDTTPSINYVITCATVAISQAAHYAAWKEG